jgi:EAL domain-containing protein (putative c-di-GMP-specific phosphodiesterase class I)
MAENIHHKRDFTNEADSRSVRRLTCNLSVAQRQTIEGALCQAIERQELRLFYQPQIDLQTGNIVGAEALVRWHHRGRKIVSSALFVSIAEECGLIVPIGRWVLRAACSQAQTWLQAGFPPMRIAINVSRAELCATDFVSELRAILAQTGLAAASLELELPGDFLLQDAALGADVLHRIKKMGIKLALGDFGTGDSNLRYLKSFPIDTVKLDRSVIRNPGIGSADASSVCSIIAMSRKMHMQVVAEGVETREQLKFLQQRGCPFGQGFFFGPPIPSEDFTQMLLRAKRRRALLARDQHRSNDVDYAGVTPRKASMPIRSSTRIFDLEQLRSTRALEGSATKRPLAWWWTQYFARRGRGWKRHG